MIFKRRYWIIVFAAAVLLSPSSFFFLLDRIGLGIETNRIDGVTINMRDKWFPFLNSKKALFRFNQMLFPGSTPESEALEFSRPTLIFLRGSYITFSKLANRDKAYSSGIVDGWREKSIVYSWGTADFVRVNGKKSKITSVVAREPGIFITTNDIRALDDIKSIVTTGDVLGSTK
jgi:hypothetical protein